jgi:hypothetical protein
MMVIERDMKGEFSAMNNRLNAEYGSRVAILEHAVSALQTDLNRINDVINRVETGQDYVTFLQESKEIRGQIEMCLAKTVPTDIPMPADGLPYELGELRE